MEQTQFSQSEINITEVAIRRVQRLMEERGVSDHALRVFVSGGGCSGLQYGMSLESEIRETDLRFSFNDINIVIDPMSMGYLAGSTIDYKDDLMGGGFQIDNPNALASCGCGNSFRTEEGQARAHNSAGCGHI